MDTGIGEDHNDTDDTVNCGITCRQLHLQKSDGLGSRLGFWFCRGVPGKLRILSFVDRHSHSYLYPETCMEQAEELGAEKGGHPEEAGLLLQGRQREP